MVLERAPSLARVNVSDLRPCLERQMVALEESGFGL